MSPDEKIEQHESYGLVQFSRIPHGGGRTRLFGSAIPNHHTTIRHQVLHGERRHDLSYDRFRAVDGIPIVEVEPSAAAFAELLTTMNMGEGAPCTIRSIDRKCMAEPPDTETEVEKVRSGFVEGMKTLQDSVRKMAVQAKTLLDGPMKAADKKTLGGLVARLAAEVIHNIPFVERSFGEAAERVVTTSKAEVEAFIVHAAVTTGIRKLRRISEENQLTDGES